MEKLPKNVGIKSEKMYEVKSLYGLKHDISLVCREYRGGKCIYILKCIIGYYKDGKLNKKVFKKVFYSRTIALRALQQDIVNITFDNIDFQCDLPF